MPSQPIKPLVDRILGGKLDQTLAAWRTEGLSYEAIARRLASEHDISVTAETIRAWFRVEPTPQDAA